MYKCSYGEEIELYVIVLFLYMYLAMMYVLFVKI